jgi:hypothetical protein
MSTSFWEFIKNAYENHCNCAECMENRKAQDENLPCSEALASCQPKNVGNLVEGR